MNIINYAVETEELILKRARKAIGLTIDEICKKSHINISNLNLKNKGNIGNIIEEVWFGIKNNNTPAPDFIEAGIELKVIPLTQDKNNTYKVKERTKICSINYKELVEESWEDSHAKKKLNKILFIYYVYNKNDITKSIVKKIDLFELKGNNSSIIKRDWNNVWDFVNNGKAHFLTESISSILSPSRSGAGGLNKDGTLRDNVSQPNSNIPALKRAFSLKQSFTNQRWQEINNAKYESILDTLDISSEYFEKEIINSLLKLENKSIADIASLFDIKISKGKNAVATIVKKAIGFKNVNSKIKEFEQLGIQVKTINLNKTNYKPFEAVSFPTFKFKELIKEEFYEGKNEDTKEEWENCTFLQNINRILFIPILRNSQKELEFENRILGKAFFWSPSVEELRIIEKEWLNYKNEINDGKVAVERKYNSKGGYREVNGLKPASKTEIIHIRPHAKDRSDRDEDHLGNSIIKQSFWLNKKFLQKLIENNYNN
ncbi:Sau3AI family type II restriction endonuclease [Poseidonibacter lekithochrous]|uniref:Sau3AI family type II restriction endonuclease n=1 Tax=Poseidonibacter lekithochrous TaxID=1904463 RepID=UPI000D3708B3|nr:Sau3AI family type II restriction endonuclease [Poseidonibacter lekithochrous]